VVQGFIDGEDVVESVAHDRWWAKFPPVDGPGIITEPSMVLGEGHTPTAALRDLATKLRDR